MLYIAIYCHILPGPNNNAKSEFPRFADWHLCYLYLYLRSFAGLQALSQAISHGAMHDSSERGPPPRCHPGTRKKVADDIVQWLEDLNASTSVLWVNGRAGVGKSALMQTMAELLSANNLLSHTSLQST